MQFVVILAVYGNKIAANQNICMYLERSKILNKTILLSFF